MGCDIHLHSEIKVAGKWEHYGCHDIDRDYRLFAKMAGVRNDGQIDPISEPRGLPDDISVVTKLEAKSWGSDGHSHSWLSCEEIGQLEAWLWTIRKNETGFWLPEMLWGSLFSEKFSSWCEDKTRYPKEIEDVRFVFWFDS